jgi:hypothetical protein
LSITSRNFQKKTFIWLIFQAFNSKEKQTLQQTFAGLNPLRKSVFIEVDGEYCHDRQTGALEFSGKRID